MQATSRRSRKILVVAGLVCLVAGPAWSGSHLWIVNEVFSNASGNLQFVELFTSSPNEGGISNKSVTSLTNTSDPFPSPIAGSTANKHLLLATADFAALPGVPTPEIILPDNFLSTVSDSIKWHIYNASILDYTAGELPTDGVSSLRFDGSTGSATPANLNGPMAPPAASGLAVAKFPQFPDGSRLQLTWNSGTCLGEASRHIIIGTSADLPSNPGGAFTTSAEKCDISASPYVWAGVPAASSGDFMWFLVMSNDGGSPKREGSWGKDSSGAERVGPMAGGASGTCLIFNKTLANACGG